MERNEVVAKLKALHNNIAKWLEDRHVAGRTRPALYFNPEVVLDLFQRFAPLRDVLRSEYPSLVDDLPVREVPKPSGTADYENLGYIERSSLELLLKDVDYCLDILSSMATVDVPSMKVTREGVFFAGQYFDALKSVNEILSHSKQSIVIIDGYIDENVLNLLSSKDQAVEVKILTKDASPALKTAATAFNKQYGKLSIRTSQAFHDRFVIVDDQDFYHFGASIKDLGNKGFMFSCIEEPLVIDALRKELAQEWAKATEVLLS